MHVTVENLFEAITPLMLALHEKGAVDIAELPQFYLDAVMRRLQNGATEDQVTFQRQMVLGVERLAKMVKKDEAGRPR